MDQLRRQVAHIAIMHDELVVQKRWISNGGYASWYTVFATFDPGMKHKGIACFMP